MNPPQPMFSLKDKSALVTGASQGIGRATAIALANAGARVALAARSEVKLAELAAEIAAAGGEAFVVPMDVARPEQIKAGFEAVRARFGGLHILVNNAAITRDTLALRMKPEDWDSVLQVNLTAAHIAIQQALGIMLRQKWGRIINVSSVVAQMGNAGQANYVAAKAGLIGLTKAIAVEVASRNITVNAVAPGFVVSPMTDPLSQQVKDALLARIPLGRFGRDQEIAAAIVFLASEEAGYITGHVLDVNGGLYMA
ncbi:MAG TPA: 3-oxoacyl-[acyl-carrier-protein] reductase [Candidatus Acidoferrales bacterium]|nr:3-oxoacyl-[acyl-carrier-protein] reductase [Candidatus Acidoferrales bacterium]